MTERQWSGGVIAPSFALALGLAGCSPASEMAANESPQQTATSRLSPRSPPSVPGPNYGNRSTVAVPRLSDTKGLDDEQIDAMFAAAVAQARPGKEKRAICVGMQGLADKVVADAPSRVVQRLSEELRLPAVPASRCRDGLYPTVIATEANAILYTVKVESRDRRGVLTFWANAVFGNMGAQGTQFRLVRKAGRWMTESTGLSVLS